MDFFATAAKGTEGALRDELRALRMPGVRADRGGVHFSGTWDDGFAACLHSRIALRILSPVARFPARDERALYDGVRAVDFTPFLSPRHTLAVRASGRTDALVHTQFVSRRTKDAIVDRLRDETGARPSVDLDDPDLEVFVHLAKDEASVYVDLSGESLHRRGYRTRIGAAPLKEPLAAAMLRLAGFTGEGPLADPMCGSGTIALEAALVARNVAPGIFRERFGVERWPSCGERERARAREMREEARAAERPAKEAPRIVGSDIDPDVVKGARANGNAAGVGETVRFEVCDVGAARPLVGDVGREGGVVVTNPPYGERIAGGDAFYGKMAEALSRYAGFTVGVLAGTPDIERAMRRKPEKWVALFNGPIECRYFVYRMP